MSSLKDTYNKIAADWHADHAADTWWLSGTEKFASMLTPGALVLDAGCGDGVKSRYLVDHGMRVYGIDIAENFLAIARREVPEGEFETLALEDAGKLTQEFDAIFAQASLLHVAKKDILKTLTALSDKLRRGGLFYVAVKEMREGKPEEEIKVDNDYGYTYERFFSYYTIPELEGYFKKLGLEVVHKQVEKTGKTNWIQMIARKVD